MNLKPVSELKESLSDPNTVDKTAEEIKASKQRSYSTVSDIQKALEQLVYAMDVIAQLANLNGGKKYEISFDWDDSIVIDKEQELQSMQQDATAGLIRKEIYIAAKYGVSEEEALKMMPPIKALCTFSALTCCKSCINLRPASP